MRSKAVLYGVNNYQHDNVPNLRGCVEDVKNIRGLLIREFGFSAKDILARTDHEVTLDTITADWKWLVENATPSDRLVFHFSGHGSQVANEDGDDDELDGLDEVLCLYNMDFDDPDTYLVDDRIHRWTQKLPPDVKMTFLLDCCHSGTGTRTLNPGLRSLDQSLRSLPLILEYESSRRARRAEVKRAVDRPKRNFNDGESPTDANLVFARYLVPPKDVFRQIERRRRREFDSESSHRSRVALPPNHVRISGCKDKQTSADAYIDGRFQGAFSAHFRKVIEEQGCEISHSDLMNRIRRALSDADFSQTPQMNPKHLETAVLEGLEHSSSQKPRPESPRTDSSISQEIYRLNRKFDNLYDLVLSMADGSQTASRPRPQSHTKKDSRQEHASANRSIVYVHGICWHDPGYSDDWFESLRPHLNDDLANQLAHNHHEVLWSRHVSSRSRSPEAENIRSNEAQQLADELADVLHDRAAQSMELQLNPTHSRGARSDIQSRNIERALLGIPGLDCVDDFIKYLLSKRTRRKVIQEFTKVVEPLLEQGSEIDIVSHSWGTVVALEALHQMSGESYPGRVNNLFTVGSALSIRMIQRRLQFGAESGDKPGIVSSWWNVDARGDIVGGTLRGFSSEIDDEFLNLEPVGCNEGTFGPSPSCAHASYFNERNIVVNRDVFGELISRSNRF